MENILLTKKQKDFLYHLVSIETEIYIAEYFECNQDDAKDIKKTLKKILL